ncbi:MAG: hypothetical protein ABI863_01970 [Ginsengibacter sp.]
MKQNELPEEEKFSDDPEENLRMQNNFLKMKMMAESGALFGGEGGLPADIENQFLKNVMEFEKANADAKPTTIFEVLGKPDFEDETNLGEEKFKKQFSRLQKLLRKYDMNVDFGRERDNRFKYNFITKELFEHQTAFMPVKGMSTYFSYEEFHPDHELEMTGKTSQFLNDFFERNLDADTYYINNELIEPDGNILPKEQLIKRFQSLYEVAREFENTSFNIENIQFELKDGENETSMGFSEGSVNYDMIFEDGNRQKIRGPFKIYFARKWDVWGICFFYLAGYNLHPPKK